MFRGRLLFHAVNLRRIASPLVGRGPGTIYRQLKTVEFLVTRDRETVLAFLSGQTPSSLSFFERVSLVARFLAITNRVRAYHTQAELLTVTQHILKLAGRPGLTVVEAGAGKGASTAKLSLAVRAAQGRLLVFDSFRGLPENDEIHQHLDGRTIRFRAGAFTGRLASVERTVRELGAIEVCEFHKGWFEETMPAFSGPVDVALLDVDLLSSTRACLTYLYPLLRADGAIYSQDGHLKAIVELMADPSFWAAVGVDSPRVTGLGTSKLIRIERPDKS